MQSLLFGDFVFAVGTVYLLTKNRRGGDRVVDQASLLSCGSPSGANSNPFHEKQKCFAVAGMAMQLQVSEMESSNMKSNDGFFYIESEPSRHVLYFEGEEVGVFDTLEAAESEAGRIARKTPGAHLRFELDFKSTLSDVEIRGAILESPNTESSFDRT